MYKAPILTIVTIYHIPSRQTQIGVTLNALMERIERIQYQAALAITGAWQGSCRSNLYEELGWNHYLIVVGVGEFCKYTRL